MKGRMQAVVVALALGAGGSALAAPPLTTDSGAPVGTNQSSKTAGPRGSVLLEDFHLIEKLARFDRERTPERVVHARGVGAYGECPPRARSSPWGRLSASCSPRRARGTPRWCGGC